jgi:hypothetical protein
MIRQELYTSYNLEPPAPGAPSPQEAAQQSAGVPASESEMETPVSGL